MKKLLIGLTLLGATLSASAQVANVVLDNCVLKQNPQNRTVEVSYELDGDTPVYVTLEITTNGIPIPVPVAVRGDITTEQNPIVIEPGLAPKIIRWEAKQDWPGNLTTEARATVTAWFTNDPPAILKHYAVVDLSPGPSANSYDVRYSVTPPNLADVTCKTTELWLRRIPAGTFTMGSPDEEFGRDAANEDLHQVTLTEDFYIGVFQVTQKQYERVMGTSPSGHIGDLRPVDTVSYNNIRGTTLGVQWPASDAVDADSFMGRLRARTALKFDLPTDAQWEYACRAGTTGAWNNGTTTVANLATDANLALLGRYNSNRGDGKGGFTQHAVVGSYLPNAWELYDMHGNVGEWCLDWFVSSLGTTAETNPQGPVSGSTRVMRNGTWYSSAASCRSADRIGAAPNTANNTVGFRAAIQP